MELKQFCKLGKFDPKVDKKSLVNCPECQGWYGVGKWMRSSTAAGASCPGCRTLYVAEQNFKVRPVVKLKHPKPDKQSEEKNKPQSAVLINPDGTKTYKELNLKVGSRASVKNE